jgi:hypothetical protein
MSKLDRNEPLCPDLFQPNLLSRIYVSRRNGTPSKDGDI